MSCNPGTRLFSFRLCTEGEGRGLSSDASLVQLYDGQETHCLINLQWGSLAPLHFITYIQPEPNGT